MNSTYRKTEEFEHSIGRFTAKVTLVNGNIESIRLIERRSQGGTEISRFLLTDHFEMGDIEECLGAIRGFLEASGFFNRF